MTPWLLLLVKSAVCGKSRLAPVLDDAARARLNEFLLRRALALAHRFPGRDMTAVISGCTQVLAIAAAHGFRTIEQVDGPGLNAAATHGTRELFRLGAERVLLLPCDVPSVRADDLRELASLGEAVICPDRAGQGTNALLVPGKLRLNYQFGQRSLQKHCQELARHGCSARIHRNARIAFDIDTAADLRRWSLQYPDQAQRAGIAHMEEGALACT